MITTLSTLILIMLAEMGDKSQLVCMLLATRYRALPVFFGAILAFALLNALAVFIGGALAQYVPTAWVSLAVAILFAAFGLHALLSAKEDTQSELEEAEQQSQIKGGHGVFISSFSLIFLAELGDKTQLTVAALGSTNTPFAVYAGATLALAGTTLLGILGGRWLMQHIKVDTLHRIGGGLFLLFSAYASYVFISAF